MEFGEPVGQLGTELWPRQRGGGQEGPCERHHWLEVDADELGSVLAVPGDLDVHHRLGEGPQEQRVVRRHQVDRAPHDDDADQRALLQHGADLVRVEGV